MSIWSKLFEWNLWVLMSFWFVWVGMFPLQLAIWILGWFGRVDFSDRGVAIFSLTPLIIVVLVTAYPVIALLLGARIGP